MGDISTRTGSPKPLRRFQDYLIGLGTSVIKLLETIKIVDGIPCFLSDHNHRLNHSRQLLFHCATKIDLATVILPPADRGTYRCRIIYAEKVEVVEYSPLIPRSFKTFQCVEANSINYEFKYANRDAIHVLYRRKGLADDILILKRGFVTDTSIANVAFWQETQWITPANPLLNGTTRQRLLDEQKIFPKTIHIDDIVHLNKMALMNALLGFYVIENFTILTKDSIFLIN